MNGAFAYLGNMFSRLQFCLAALLAISLATSVALAHPVKPPPPASHPEIPSPPSGSSEHPVVVELFTSQGCSDCPPADALLTELAKRNGVIALTLPVTYWDMLGWKDTFGSEANTVRQKAYAKALGRSGVYTPQIIVNGVADLVGGRRDQVVAAIAAHAHDAPAIPISIKTSPQVVQIAIAGGQKNPKDPNCTIWVMHTLNHAVVQVGDGENKGRMLDYTNIVRDLKAIGLWKGAAITFNLPRGALTSVPHDGLVVLLQRDGNGQVVGAAMVTAPAYSGKH